jgi:hypothetical protein
VGVNGNGVNPSSNNGTTAKQPTATEARTPRRLVLLADGEDSEVSEVLAEYRGAEVSGTRLHTDLQRFASERRGKFVAAEWLGKLGWTRFLWCRK